MIALDLLRLRRFLLMLAMLLTTALCLASCGVLARSAQQAVTGVRPPSELEKTHARAAWQYFRAARLSQTGLVETVAGAGFVTPSSIGDTLAAAVAARRLGVIDAREFDASVSASLHFLTRMELSEGLAPARTYNGRTGRWLRFPDQANDPGWSSVEIGRLLHGLRILAQSYPAYEPHVANAVARWSVCGLTDAERRLLRAAPGDGGMKRQPDLGTGYYDYAAQGFRLWGFDPAPAPRPTAAASVETYGISFPVASDPAQVEPLLTAPYVLMGVESHWRGPGGEPLEAERALAEQLHQVQARRWAESGILTARSDYRRAQAPYQVTDAVAAGAYLWSTADGDGRAHPALALLSTRSALGLDALFPSEATRKARRRVEQLYDPERGWFEGRYEVSGGYEGTRTSATNAAVLEVILYRNAGPLIPPTSFSLSPTAPSGLAQPACRLPAVRS